LKTAGRGKAVSGKKNKEQQSAGLKTKGEHVRKGHRGKAGDLSGRGKKRVLKKNGDGTRKGGEPTAKKRDNAKGRAGYHQKTGRGSKGPKWERCNLKKTK